MACNFVSILYVEELLKTKIDFNLFQSICMSLNINCVTNYNSYLAKDKLLVNDTAALNDCFSNYLENKTILYEILPVKENKYNVYNIIMVYTDDKDQLEKIFKYYKLQAFL